MCQRAQRDGKPRPRLRLHQWAFPRSGLSVAHGACSSCSASNFQASAAQLPTRSAPETLTSVPAQDLACGSCATFSGKAATAVCSTCGVQVLPPAALAQGVPAPCLRAIRSSQCNAAALPQCQSVACCTQTAGWRARRQRRAGHAGVGSLELLPRSQTCLSEDRLSLVCRTQATGRCAHRQ